jgi:hypothetical protein
MGQAGAGNVAHITKGARPGVCLPEFLFSGKPL